jgi:hypothetical protein
MVVVTAAPSDSVLSGNLLSPWGNTLSQGDMKSEVFSGGWVTGTSQKITRTSGSGAFAGLALYFRNANIPSSDQRTQAITNSSGPRASVAGITLATPKTVLLLATCAHAATNAGAGTFGSPVAQFSNGSGDTGYRLACYVKDYPAGPTANPVESGSFGVSDIYAGFLRTLEAK